MQILTAFALLIPAFSLLYTPDRLRYCFTAYNAPLQYIAICLSFDVQV